MIPLRMRGCKSKWHVQEWYICSQEKIAAEPVKALLAPLWQFESADKNIGVKSEALIILKHLSLKIVAAAHWHALWLLKTWRFIF